MKAQVRVKTKIRGATEPFFAVQMKKRTAGGLVGRRLEML
jgi:hypothetical protein